VYGNSALNVAGGWLWLFATCQAVGALLGGNAVADASS
jgi:hypothetical protein